MKDVGAIKQQLQNLNDALSAYIGVHNIVLHQRLGEKLNYEKMIGNLEASIATTDSVEKELIKSLEGTHIALRYLVALRGTQNQLLHILVSLKNKSEGQSYGFFAYRGDMKKYKVLEGKYFSLGSELNAWFKTLI